jgi:hypothetical protein
MSVASPDLGQPGTARLMKGGEAQLRQTRPRSNEGRLFLSIACRGMRHYHGRTSQDNVGVTHKRHSCKISNHPTPVIVHLQLYVILNRWLIEQRTRSSVSFLGERY